MPIGEKIARNFGNLHGLARLALSYPQAAILGHGLSTKAEDVRRLVFVCHANVSRSAFAEVLCSKRGMNAASFGVAAEAGAPADETAQKVALDDYGVDLTWHRAQDTRFHALPGDLLLAMEVRQLNRIANLPNLSIPPRALLGSVIHVPHLHDPLGLSEDYYRTCFNRILRAVDRLEIRFPRLKTGHNS
ncbi:phosphotyrosine protein phosphatase [Alterisphingorhabdus coralli]|uniref:Phosphotyrosine protein phosphatase n=1 Tax=Alterisphingorhabdus coralli TaxID=3071408 RepID=A0AA97I2C9_9SPHN|nr:phosphotyrosine protein phosphatase [Parasphingorhabdus sp. SCSIO 66989]WOE76260.1 phosphotyrosine protein phosphatase [Parasphingorhabdus sp. SCSIO 66989]